MERADLPTLRATHPDLDLKPMAAVLDAAGHPLAVLRDEQASFLPPQIATGKDHGYLGMGFGGCELALRA